jgi:hypothetical protein
MFRLDEEMGLDMVTKAYHGFCPKKHMVLDLA